MSPRDYHFKAKAGLSQWLDISQAFRSLSRWSQNHPKTSTIPVHFHRKTTSITFHWTKNNEKNPPAAWQPSTIPGQQYRQIAPSSTRAQLEADRLGASFAGEGRGVAGDLKKKEGQNEGWLLEEKQTEKWHVV